MRKATEAEQAFFDSVEVHPAFQLLVSFFALIGFTVMTGFAVTAGTGTLSVFRTVMLVLIGMAGGYTLRAIRE